MWDYRLAGMRQGEQRRNMTSIRNDIYLYGHAAALRMRVAYIIARLAPGRYKWSCLVFWALCEDEFPRKQAQP